MYIGQKITTANPGGVTLDISGRQVSLDRSTQVQFKARHAITLLRGRIFFTDNNSAQQLEIHTRYGQLRDVGTAYEAAISDNSVVVIMRDGQVEIEHANDKQTITVHDGLGEARRIDVNGIHHQPGRRTTSDAWDWHKRLREPLTLSGTTVADYLAWMARDQGFVLSYRSRAVAQLAKTRTLVAPDDKTSDDWKLTDVLASTDFDVEQLNDYTWQVDFLR